jgi:hypothetical protein
MKPSGIFLVLCAAAMVLSISCQTATPVKTAAPTSGQEAAKAPVAAKEAAKAPAVAKDYLGENIKLAGIGDRVGGPYTVNFYTAEVTTPPSAATKNEGLVKPIGKVEGSSGTEFWTPYIASSRPATKDELQPGMLVFAVGDAQPRSREALANISRWELFRVKDVSNLYKGTVILTYQNTYGSIHWRDSEHHVDNIRVLLGELPLVLAELPE